MHDPNYGDYDTQEGYETPSLPYIPYAAPSPVDSPSAPMSPPLDQLQPHVASDSPYGEPAPYVPAGSDTPPGMDTNNPFPSPYPPVPPPAKKSRRRLWIVLGIVAALLVIVSASTFALVSYLNRSTPLKTMDAFCSAVTAEHYDIAYSQFSKQLQSQFTEPAFADVLAQDKVTNCSHTDVADTGGKATTNLKLVHSSKGVNNDKVMLVQDGDSNWKIDDLQKIS